ncbi:DUF1761 domain-containing protein [Pelagibius sp. Alg239-R121]|uniref:DUF1761 domain-containing protein n=1 Tax=Pelagibius sp. Alg239-R121 TaxID=2993448 RepID=UPI0024A77229|nr:DUF1761 domain-containing protein [Pelagibius sp. Alg239-R121]
MLFTGINYIAVLVAGVASYAFGSVYYMSLAKPWMAAVGKTEEEFKSGSSPRVFIVAFAAQLVMAFMLAGVLGHLVLAGEGGAVAGSSVSLVNGLITALCVWFGFILMAMLVNHGFQGAKRSLTVIDSGHWLGVLLIQGAVIGLFGV